MSDDAKTAVEIAAEVYAHQPLNRNVLDECKGLDRVTDRVRHIERTAFKAGAEWAVSNDPRVLALVEQYERMLDWVMSNHMLDLVMSNHRMPHCSEMVAAAHEILAAFRDAQVKDGEK